MNEIPTISELAEIRARHDNPVDRDAAKAHEDITALFRHVYELHAAAGELLETLPTCGYGLCKATATKAFRDGVICDEHARSFQSPWPLKYADAAARLRALLEAP